MKALFICNTPFQVLTALLLHASKGMEADLYLVNSFGGVRELASSIINEKVFQQVKIIDETLIWKSKSTNIMEKRWSTVQTYMNCQRIVEGISPEIHTYTELFVANRAAINRLFCMYMAKHNRECQIHYFDDGIGTYDGTVIDVKRSDYLLRRLLVGGRAADFVYDLYLYSPELYRERYPDRRIDTKKMPILRMNEQIDRIFGVGKNDRFDTKSIILDIIPEVEFDHTGRDNYIRIIETILNFSECTIKPHPRAEVKNFNCKYFNNTKIPFEVLCYKQDFSNHVLITNFSTAVLTPKLLFNQEPAVILLYQLNREHRKNGKKYDDNIIELFREYYTDQSRIFVPNNRDELMEVLDRIQAGSEDYEIKNIRNS